MRIVLIGILLASCTIYESGGSGGGDDEPGPGSGGGGGTPVGRSFVLDRGIIGGEPCAFVEESGPVSLEILTTTAINFSMGAASSITVRNTPAREGTDAPNVVFKASERWSGNGFANPTVNYQIWVDATLVTGRADTSFQHVLDGTMRTCSYNWVLSAL